MRNFIKSFSLLAALLVVILLINLKVDPKSEEPTTDKPVVAATIFPLADMVQKIAGDTLLVQEILPPGASPHTFEPKPSDITRLSESKIVFAIGHNLDDWADIIVDASGAKKVIVDGGITLRSGSDEPIDPHYWLSAINAQIIAQNIYKELSTAYPENASVYLENLDNYTKELQQADKQVRDILAKAPNKNIMTSHDAWYYFAADYGLNIVGTFTPTAGKEPTPQYLAELEKTVRDYQIKVLFGEPGQANAGIESFAKDNQLEIRTLNPEGGTIGQDTFINLLLQNATVIAK